MNDFRTYVGKDYSSYLMHYGVSKRNGAKIGSGRYPLGSGKDPYQHADIYTKRAHKASTTKDKVDNILSTMSKEDLEKLAIDDEGYLTIDQGSYVVKRVLKTIGDIPVSFFDLLEDSQDQLNVALGTRGGSEYRGKGYSSKATDQAMKWLEKNKDKYSYKKVIWGVRVDNPGSIKIAKKNGFELDPDSYSDDGMWVNYVKKLK